MEISKTLYVKKREQWRKWLEKNHLKKPDIWLVFYKKNSGKQRIPYNDAVKEALCYGWIDSTVKPVDEICYAHRFSPRRNNSKLSEMNRERVRRLIKEKKMTEFGLEKIKHELYSDKETKKKKPKLKRYVLSADILRELKKYPAVWKNF